MIEDPKTGSWLRWILAPGLLLVAGCPTYVVYCGTQGTQEIAEGITQSGVSGIRQGMTEEQIVSLLGDPLLKKPVGKDGQEVISYAEPCLPCWGGFELRLFMIDGKVHRAWAEFHDLGVWFCSDRFGCPYVMDQGTLDQFVP